MGWHLKLIIEIEVNMPPRTIDNLGVDVSSRYAEDQKLLDEKIIKEARGIAPQTIVDVTQPYYSSEFEALFELGRRNLPWADFQAPAKYNEQKKRLFTHQIIPALGTPDKKDNQTQKIIAKAQNHLAKRQQEKDQQKEPKKKFIEEREDLQIDKEKKVLIKLLDCIVYLDKNIADVNSRRSQYQKG